VREHLRAALAPSSDDDLVVADAEVGVLGGGIGEQYAICRWRCQLSLKIAIPSRCKPPRWRYKDVEVDALPPPRHLQRYTIARSEAIEVLTKRQQTSSRET
jgi:hypothetical protein